MLIFDPKDVIAEYNYSQGTEVTNAKHKKQLKEFVKDINDNNIEKMLNAFLTILHTIIMK